MTEQPHTTAAPLPGHPTKAGAGYDCACGACVAKPVYRDRYPCAACRTGYLDCAAGATISLMCCKDCDGHPERFVLGNDAYTQDEYDDMKRRAER